MKNKEFLFLYDAAMCNPNGDPDQENRPRMDRKNQINLVSDGRLKRYIRDFLLDGENNVFVSNDEGKKISVEKKLHKLITQISKNKEEFNALVARHDNLKKSFDGLDVKNQDYQAFYESKLPTTNDNDKQAKPKWKALKDINNELLVALVKEELIDIRMFGGAFAVAGFSNTFIGAIQINWGYSLHPVEIIDSNTIVTLMSGNAEGESNMGKKEGLFYSLIAFTGTINAKRANELSLSDKEDVDSRLEELLKENPQKETILSFKDKNIKKEDENLEKLLENNPNKEEIKGLLNCESDVCKFRNSIINSLFHTRTDSKKNQYPKLYLEIEYKDNACYGRLGDLRNLVSVTSKKTDKNDFEGIRSLKELNLDFSELETGINEIKDKIHKVSIWKAIDKAMPVLNIDWA